MPFCKTRVILLRLPSGYNSKIVHVTLSPEIWMSEICLGSAVDIRPSGSASDDTSRFGAMSTEFSL